MYIYIYHVSLYVYMHMYTYICMHACMHACMYLRWYHWVLSADGAFCGRTSVHVPKR